MYRHCNKTSICNGLESLRHAFSANGYSSDLDSWPWLAMEVAYTNDTMKAKAAPPHKARNRISVSVMGCSRSFRETTLGGPQAAALI